MVLEAVRIEYYELVAKLSEMFEYESQESQDYFYYLLFKQRVCRNDTDGIKELIKIFPEMKTALLN